jgi:hypothetical protein
MHAALLITGTTIALLLLLDGVATIASARYFERRQKILRMTVEAPQGLDKHKYLLINRVIAGLCTIGACAVVVFWISQFTSLY